MIVSLHRSLCDVSRSVNDLSNTSPGMLWDTFRRVVGIYTFLMKSLMNLKHTFYYRHTSSGNHKFPSFDLQKRNTHTHTHTKNRHHNHNLHVLLPPILTMKFSRCVLATGLSLVFSSVASVNGNDDNYDNRDRRSRPVRGGIRNVHNGITTSSNNNNDSDNNEQNMKLVHDLIIEELLQSQNSIDGVEGGHQRSLQGSTTTCGLKVRTYTHTRAFRLSCLCWRRGYRYDSVLSLPLFLVLVVLRFTSIRLSHITSFAAFCFSRPPFVAINQTMVV